MTDFTSAIRKTIALSCLLAVLAGCSWRSPKPEPSDRNWTNPNYPEAIDPDCSDGVCG